MITKGEVLAVWSELTPSKRRRLARTVFNLVVNFGLTGYQVRRQGWKEGLHPHFIWNVPVWRQKVYYASLLANLLSQAYVNELNEKDLQKYESAKMRIARNLAEVFKNPNGFIGDTGKSNGSTPSTPRSFFDER